MGSEDLLASRALPGLLVLALAACGGRYASVGDEDDSGGSSAGPSGAAGKSPGKTQGDPDPGGPIVGQGGASTGSGGTAQGGFVGKGGSGIVTGGTLGTAGTAVGGSGGASPGTPVSTYELCKDYCSALSAPCPEREVVPCMKLCAADLTGSACLQRKRDDYACIADAVRSASSCQGATFAAAKLCGGVEPIPCTDACDVSVFGDGMGCHAITSCDFGEADLHCIETGGVPACYCSTSTVMAKLDGSPYTSSKQACTDDAFRQLCADYLR